MKWLRRRRSEAPRPVAVRPLPSPARPTAEQLWGGARRTAGAPRPTPVRPRPHPGADRRALGYVWLEDAAGTPEFAGHADTVERLCAARGLRLSDLTCEVRGRHGSPGTRPGLAWALQRLSAGEARALVVPTLDHLSGAFGERADALSWFRERGVCLIATDVRAGAVAEADGAAATARALGARTAGQDRVETLGVGPRSWALGATGASPMRTTPAGEPA